MVGTIRVKPSKENRKKSGKHPCQRKSRPDRGSYRRAESTVARDKPQNKIEYSQLSNSFLEIQTLLKLMQADFQSEITSATDSRSRDEIQQPPPNCEPDALSANAPIPASNSESNSALASSLATSESNTRPSVGSISSALLLNIQSINPSARSSTRWKIQYIRNKVEQKSKHISVPFIALTETWLKPYINDSQLDIKNYNISRCDRSTRVGGGVLLYSQSHESLPTTSFETFDDKICQALLRKCETAEIIICVIYCPPDSPISSFKACLEFIAYYISDHESYETCLLGDFNFPMIDWNSGVILSGSSSATNQSAVLLLDFMADNLLSQYILEPTRLNNCLDLCLSNAPNLVTHVSVTDTPLSDHKLLEIFLSHDPCRPDPLVLPNFSVSSFRSLDFYKADYDRINHLLDYVNWNKLWQLCDPEEFPELLNLVLLQICEIGCPRKQASVRRRGSSVSTLSRKKRKLKLWLQLAEQNPVATAAHLESLRNQISSVHDDMRDVINQDLNYREQQAVDKVHSNPKYFYSYTKKFSKHKRRIPMLFNWDKRTCTNPEEIANILQCQFISVFSDPSATNINDALFQVPSLEKPLSDIMLAFSVVDIVEAIDEIKPGAAAGPDDLSLLLLKKCKEILSKPIYMIWQHSMSTGTVPKFYKTSHIAPLHKKGSRAIAANYSPFLRIEVNK